MQINHLFKHTALLLLACLPSSFLFSQHLLMNTIAGVAQRAGGKVGMYAEVLETGDTAGYHATDRFPMQSVYKFPIAMAILDKVDQGKWSLNDSILVLPGDILQAGHSPIREQHPNGNVKLTLSELLRYNVSESDGTACDVLLRLLGGPKKVKKYLHHIGVKHIAVTNTENQIQTSWPVQYKNHATPVAMGKLLRVLYTKPVLSEQSKNALLQWMIQSSPGAKRIKGLLPEGTIVAHKTGTSGTNAAGITAATNDVGIVTLPNGHHLVLAVFVSDSPADSTTREAVIAGIAKAVWDTWKN